MELLAGIVWMSGLAFDFSLPTLPHVAGFLVISYPQAFLSPDSTEK